jgi:hypothetical protein
MQLSIKFGEKKIIKITSSQKKKNIYYSVGLNVMHNLF